MSTMVEILQRIIETRGVGCQHGLCWELAHASDCDWVQIRSLFETWEHFSGSRRYPVPDPDHPGDKDEATRIFMRLGEYDRFIGEYGELRLDLARHLLKELSK